MTVAYGLMGHAHNKMAKEALEYLGYEVVGIEPDPCNGCREVKTRKEAIKLEIDWIRYKKK